MDDFSIEGFPAGGEGVGEVEVFDFEGGNEAVAGAGEAVGVCVGGAGGGAGCRGDWGGGSGGGGGG